MSSAGYQQTSASSSAASSSSSIEGAFKEVVKSIQQDMPLIMHGSGDVQPNEVNVESARVLSELTANYISQLVDAAIDAHDILNSQAGGGLSQPLPPPPMPRNKSITKPSKPEPMTITKSTSGSSSSKKTSSKSDTKSKSDKKSKAKDTKDQNLNNNSQQQHHRKRRRVTDEYWDEPMAEPKIKSRPDKQSQEKATPGPKFEGVPIDEWVGVAGVDFFDQQRSRKAYVNQPTAIGTSSFVFPVCHDPLLYGKVKEVQAARRSLNPILADPVVQDVVKNEGAIHGAGGLRKRSHHPRNNNRDNIEDPEDTDSEGEDGATWPSLDGLLPVYMNRDLFGGWSG